MGFLINIPQIRSERDISVDSLVLFYILQPKLGNYVKDIHIS